MSTALASLMISRHASMKTQQLAKRGVLGVMMLGVPKTAVAAFSAEAATLMDNLLKDATLLPPQTKDSFAVYNPAQPGHVVGYAPNMARGDAKKAIEMAQQALPSWRDETTGQHRSSLLQKWSQLIQENAEDIATIMTLESGKPLQESLGEVNYGVSFLDYYASEAIRPTGAGGGFMVPTPFVSSTNSPRGKVMAVQEAVGVTAMITPWNFPMAMITRKVGPALAAGCAAVVKPSEMTPLTAIALQTLSQRAGIPADIFSIVTSDSNSTPEIGDEFCTNEIVKKISFTGSTPVGKLLMRLSSDSVKRLSLELGGNAPFVVFEDADIDQAVSAAMASKFRNAGQTCVCADRFLVHSSVRDEFVEKLARRASEDLCVGDGLESTTTMGPLISSKAATQVHDKVQQAIQEYGATCVMGGTLKLNKELGSHFYEPTILTDVSPQASIFKEETFGPVAAIVSFETEEQALQIANDSKVGLASYFCTNDISRAFRFASRLECGIVGLNEGIISTTAAPFGGVKESGLGREGSALGIAEYLETKYIFLNV